MNLLKMNIFQRFFTPSLVKVDIAEVKEGIENKGGVNKKPTMLPSQEPPMGQGEIVYKGRNNK